VPPRLRRVERSPLCTEGARTAGLYTGKDNV